jgi:hypothetical protein
MSPWLALAVVTWAALLVLYLGFAATMRQVRLLRAELTSLRAGGHARAVGVDLRLPALADARAPRTRLVVAADTGCPACHLTVGALRDLAPRLRTTPILLTYESPDVWRSAAEGLDVRRDPDSWRLLAHLSPPVLMTVDAMGQVADVVLPTHRDDVTRALDAWGLTPTPEVERI